MRVRYKNLFAFTGDAALPLMESFVVEDGRIVPDDAPADREVDLAGGFVTPLFSDQHTHPSYVAQTLSALAALPPDVLSIEDLVEGLVRKKDELPEDAWIEGWGYDESLLKENRSPTRHDLDRVATDRVGTPRANPTDGSSKRPPCGWSSASERRRTSRGACKSSALWANTISREGSGSSPK